MANRPDQTKLMRSGQTLSLVAKLLPWYLQWWQDIVEQVYEGGSTVSVTLLVGEHEKYRRRGAWGDWRERMRQGVKNLFFANP